MTVEVVEQRQCLWCEGADASVRTIGPDDLFTYFHEACWLAAREVLWGFTPAPEDDDAPVH